MALSVERLAKLIIYVAARFPSKLTRFEKIGTTAMNYSISMFRKLNTRN